MIRPAACTASLSSARRRCARSLGGRARGLVRAQLEVDLCDVEHAGEVGPVLDDLLEDVLGFVARDDEEGAP